MRGDSLRDLYAKTLAVVGLGLLAGAGAIVDYWPVGGELPAVPVAARLNFGVPDRPVTQPPDIPAPVMRPPMSRAIPIETHVIFSEAFRSADAVDVFAPVPPAEPEPLPVPDFDFTFAGGPLPESFLSMVDVDFGPAPGLSDGSDDGHRFLVGALRKTRESLRDARWFLGGKFQGVVGAFRKVSPFWDASSTLPLR